MAYKDKKLGELFPTRHGEASGTANERQMLDAINDTPNFRTRIQNNANGTTTRLRSRGGFPEFVTDSVATDSPTEQAVDMDSGAIDVVNTSQISPLRYSDGILHYGSIERLYFSLARLLGKISTTRITLLSNNPPVELSAPTSYLVSQDGFGHRDQDLLDLLYAKKICSVFAPASMFCGKARLYVQAQYGAPLKRWSLGLNLGGDTPSLYYGGTEISTSSGIYIDDQLTHWLLTLNGSGVSITRLKRHASVKPLVKKLGPSATVDDVLDRDKIEAYIMSRSYPDSDMSFSITISGLPPISEMLGYGWKFNWSGTKADIISHSVLPDNTFQSKHYSCSFSRDGSLVDDHSLSTITREKLRWSASVHVVEVSNWHNTKSGQVIAYPLWGQFVLNKFGTSGGSAAGDAPVYCFYKKQYGPKGSVVNDALEVFRYFGDGNVSQIKYQRVSTPTNWMGNHDWTIENYGLVEGLGTLGYDGGDGERRQRDFTPFTSGFSCSSASTITTTQSYSFTHRSISAKSLDGWQLDHINGASNWIEYVQDSVLTESVIHVCSDGVQVYGGGSYVPTPDVPTGAFEPSAVYNSITTASFIDSTGTHSEASDHVLIIPFNDSEAAYVYGVKSETRDESGNSGTGSGATKVYSYKLVWGFGEWGSHVTLGSAGGTFQPWPTSWDSFSESNTTYTILDSKLVTSGGVFDFSPPESLSPFFDGGVAFVELPYFTQSSVQGACIGHGASNLDGYISFAEPVPFIGWA